MRVRCRRCGKLASNQYPCKFCGNKYTMGAPGMTRIIEVEVPDEDGLVTTTLSGHEVHLFRYTHPGTMFGWSVLLFHQPGDDSHTVVTLNDEQLAAIQSAKPHDLNS